MAAPRLPFLWPMLWKTSVEVRNPATRVARATARNRAFHLSSRTRQQPPSTSRYGTANEPPSHLGGGKGFGPPTNQQPPEKAKALPKIGEQLQKDGEKEVQSRQAQASTTDATTSKAEPTKVEIGSTNRKMSDPMLDSADEVPTEEPPSHDPSSEEPTPESVLESVPDPLKASGEKKERFEQKWEKTFDEHAPPIKAPHMEAPRHVHHFDTYGLVMRLAEEGWDEKHAVTIMKAVRSMLADNTDLANEALVSKSNLENETYLFKAACAELKTEVTSRRRGEQEKQRTQRTQLQHEVDILGQRLGQESSNMKDELKGLFDDRKMAVRNEQREMESKLQQLNQRITVSLQADARSEVEGLRWVMTRRVIITLVTVVLMVVGSLKALSTMTHDSEDSLKRRNMYHSSGTQTDEFADASNGRTHSPGEVLVKEGDNPAFVSLG